MALFRNGSQSPNLSKLEYGITSEVDYVARSAETQARKKLAVMWS